MKTFSLSLLFLACVSCVHAQTSGSGNHVILPENLAFFHATRTGSTVNLRWQTVNEQNSKGFTVQRKTGGGWETVSFLPSNSGGNSSAKVLYEYNETNGFRGVTQYRVAEVTNGGKHRWSEVKAVRGEAQTAEVLLYPNPTTNGRIYLVFDNGTARDVAVYNAAGKAVTSFNGVTDTNLVVENLQPGLHLVRITNRTTGKTVSHPFVVAQR